MSPLPDDFTLVPDDYKWRVKIEPDPSRRAAFHLTQPHMVQQSAIIEAEDYVEQWTKSWEQAAATTAGVIAVVR
jgi:hypothetical protein